MHVETFGARLQNRRARNIHQTILALGSKLGMAVDGRYRERLAKTAYTLRDLEELLQRDGKLAEHSPNSEVGGQRRPLLDVVHDLRTIKSSMEEDNAGKGK